MVETETDQSHSLREVLGKFVTGVTVVTASGPEGPVGITANSFTSVSLDPALVLFCVHHASRVRAIFGATRSFAVNILAEHQESVSRRFSHPTDKRSKGIEFYYGSTGSPLLTDALAYLDCDLYQQIDAGDHMIVIGQVRDFKVQSTGIQPLAFYGGRYANLSLPEPFTRGERHEPAGVHMKHITTASGGTTMHGNSSNDVPDHGLIAPISVPDTDRIPDKIAGNSTSAEYDKYFRLSRNAIDLATWTRTCLTVNKELTQDLDESGLSDSDKHEILVGLVTVQDVTLSRWLATVSGPEDSES